VLREEITLNNIRGTVVEAGVDFQASQVGDADEQYNGGIAYMDVLNKAVAGVGECKELIQTQVEQIPMGHGNITHPKRDDPYLKLHRQAIQFIIELRDHRDEMEAWLKQSQN